MQRICYFDNWAENSFDSLGIMFDIKIIDSVVKGYHHFQIKPPMNIVLNVDLEYTNVHDENAALIWIPYIYIYTY